MDQKPMKVAVLGCGMISEIYLTNMIGKFDNLEVAACCDLDPVRAAARAEQFRIPSRTMEDILADTSIEMVVVLTPAPAHYEIIRQALLAGKHVYTEKTMTIDLARAGELVELAEEKGVYLGAAPDTFLGAALQLGRRTVDSGALGEVTSFHMSRNVCLDKNLCKYLFLRKPGGGICYDLGVYYITALVSLLGPIDSVCAVVENRKPVRIGCVEDGADFGQPYEYNNEAQLSAILRTKSGVTGTFVLNGESIGANQHAFSLFGTEAVLQLPDPNNFGGDVTLIRSRQDVQTLENTLPYAENSRGIGPSEMARAIREGRVNRASKEQAYHVLDVIECIMESSKTGCFVKVKSDCPLVAPLENNA